MRRKKKKNNFEYWIDDDAGEGILMGLVFEEAMLQNPFRFGSAQHFVYALRRLICEYNKLYYWQNTSAVTDYEYDTLLRKLEYYVAKYPQTYHPLCPTLQVGSACCVWPPLMTYRQDMLF